MNSRKLFFKIIVTFVILIVGCTTVTIYGNELNGIWLINNSPKLIMDNGSYEFYIDEGYSGHNTPYEKGNYVITKDEILLKKTHIRKPIAYTEIELFDSELYSEEELRNYYTTLNTEQFDKEILKHFTQYTVKYNLIENVLTLFYENDYKIALTK